MNGRNHYFNGFTLIELLISLTVMAIILAAAVTLSYALSSAYDSSSDLSEKQTQVRYANLRISGLIRQSKLVCARLYGDLVVWRADDNGDNQINISEIVYIETGYSNNYLRLLQFTPDAGEDLDISLILIQWWYFKSVLTTRYPQVRTTLLEKCDSIKVTLDEYPPYTRMVNITFNIEEDNQVRTYQINSCLRCWAGYLIDNSHRLVLHDDD